MKKVNLSILILLISTLFSLIPIFPTDSANKFIHIEWEKNELASEYHLQISDSVKFFNILYQKKTKDSLIRLEPNPSYKYGRIAGIDQHGVKGEYSEVFEIEQRIVEKKAPIPVTPLPSNYLGENHLITLNTEEDNGKHKKTFYKLNTNNWLTYNGAITLTKQGQNVLHYYSEDNLGNKEPIKTNDYILDTEGPVVEVLFHSSYTDKEKFTFTGHHSKIEIKVSDLYSGVKSTNVYLRTIHTAKEMEIDPKGQISIPIEFANSTIELYILSEDKLGNKRIYSKFFKHDLSSPELNVNTIQKIAGNGKRISLSQVEANDSYSGVKNIYFSINNSQPQIYAEPISIYQPGEHELKIYAVDNVGNLSSDQYERIFLPEPK